MFRSLPEQGRLEFERSSNGSLNALRRQGEVWGSEHDIPSGSRVWYAFFHGGHNGLKRHVVILLVRVLSVQRARRRRIPVSDEIGFE